MLTKSEWARDTRQELVVLTGVRVLSLPWLQHRGLAPEGLGTGEIDFRPFCCSVCVWSATRPVHSRFCHTVSRQFGVVNTFIAEWHTPRVLDLCLEHRPTLDGETAGAPAAGSVRRRTHRAGGAECPVPPVIGDAIP